MFDKSIIAQLIKVLCKASQISVSVGYKEIIEPVKVIKNTKFKKKGIEREKQFKFIRFQTKDNMCVEILKIICYMYM